MTTYSMTDAKRGAILFRASMAAAMFCVAWVTPASADWPQWGGPGRNFVVDSHGLADSWPDQGPPRLWVRPLGEGYSAIVADKTRLYTMYRDGQDEVVVALQADDGATVWEHRYPAKTYQEHDVQYGKGPNATPLLLGDRVVTVGFTGLMHCVDVDTGKVIWSHDLIHDFGGKIQEYGSSASPLAYQGKVITLVGGKAHGVVAFWPADGSVAWKSGPHDISYASPVIAEVDGQDQVIFFSSTEVIGIEADGGAFCWSHPVVNKYKNNAASVIWGPDSLLWAATQQDGGTRVLKLTRVDGKTRVEQVWFDQKIREFFWNAIRVDGHVYCTIGDGPTFLSAVDVKTGEIRYKERGFSRANCIYADGKLILLDQDGQLALARVTPQEATILSKCQLLEKVSWTAPTLVGRTLYVRDKKRIMALDLGIRSEGT